MNLNQMQMYIVAYGRDDANPKLGKRKLTFCEVKHLNFAKYDCVCCLQVIEDDKQWWKLRNRSGQAGYVPFNMLDVVKIEEPEAAYNQVICCTTHAVY